VRREAAEKSVPSSKNISENNGAKNTAADKSAPPPPAFLDADGERRDAEDVKREADIKAADEAKDHEMYLAGKRSRGAAD
jgi:hypothetical protein